MTMTIELDVRKQTENLTEVETDWEEDWDAWEEEMWATTRGDSNVRYE